MAYRVRIQERGGLISARVNGKPMRRLDAYRSGLRATFVGRDCVLKVDKPGEIPQTFREVTRYKQLSDQLKAFVPELLDYSTSSGSLKWSLWRRVYGLSETKYLNKWQQLIVQSVISATNANDINPRASRNCGVDRKNQVWVYDLGY